MNGEPIDATGVSDPQGFILATFTDPVNIIVGLCILGSMCTGAHLARINKHKEFRYYCLNACGILGIFGTFVGIFIGLNRFDSTNISDSIPMLLDGMKIAFFTSIMGMGATIVLKGVYAYFSSRYNPDAAEEDEYLLKISRQLETVSKDIKGLAESFDDSMNEDAEGSMISALNMVCDEIAESREKTVKTLNSFANNVCKEVAESREKTVKTLNSFANNVSETSSKAIVKGLGKVVDNFSVTLNDAVNKVFVDVKESTENLNTWQKEHKEILDKQHKNMQDLLERCDELYKAYGDSQEGFNRFSRSMKSMDKTIKNISLKSGDVQKFMNEGDAQRAALDSALESIKNAGDSLKQVVSEIHDGFADMRDKVIEAHETSDKLMHQSMDKANDFMQEQTERINDSLQSNTAKLDKVADDVVRQVDKMTKDTGTLVSVMQQDSDNHSSMVDRMMLSVMQRFDQMLAKTDKALEEIKSSYADQTSALSRSASALSQQVGQLSQDNERIMKEIRSDYKGQIAAAQKMYSQQVKELERAHRPHSSVQNFVSASVRQLMGGGRPAESVRPVNEEAYKYGGGAGSADGSERTDRPEGTGASARAGRTDEE